MSKQAAAKPFVASIWQENLKEDLGSSAREVNRYIRDLAASEGKEIVIEDLPLTAADDDKKDNKDGDEKPAAEGSSEIDLAVASLASSPAKKPRNRRRKNQGGNRTVFVCSSPNCSWKCVVRRKQSFRGSYNKNANFRIAESDSILVHDPYCTSVYIPKLRDLQNNRDFTNYMEKNHTATVQQTKMDLGALLNNVPDKTTYRAICAVRADLKSGKVLAGESMGPRKPAPDMTPAPTRKNKKGGKAKSPPAKKGGASTKKKFVGKQKMEVTVTASV